MNLGKLPISEVKRSRAKALEQIKTYLLSDDVDSQFKDRDGSYHSKDKFIVTWNGNYQGIPSEFSIDKTADIYNDFYKVRAIYVCRSLLHEKTLREFPSIERALIVMGWMLQGNKKDPNAIEFFRACQKKYNERLKIKTQ
jgi:hypothetical protein